jgi:hypothetical protein
MSTSIKRIALVAVAALGLGVLSVAPSQAADNVLLKYTTGDATAAAPYNTGTGVAGAFNYVTVTADTWSATAGTDYVITTDSTFVGSDGGTISADKKALVGNVLGNKIQVATPSVGTVTVSYWKRTAGVLAATAAETVVITVNATKQTSTYSAANSSAILAKGETTTAPTVDAVVTAVATANPDTAVATVKVVLKDALKAALNDTVTATIVSGSANVLVLTGNDTTTVGVAGDATSRATAIASSSALTTFGTAYVLIFSNGISGPASVKISLSDGTVVATKSVTFSSTTVASITPTVNYALVTRDDGQPTDGVTTSTYPTSAAVTLVLKDASGYAISGASITSVTPDVTTYISSAQCSGTTDSTGSIDCSVTPVAGKYGKTVLTFKSGTVSATATLTTAAAKASSIAITGPASVEAGSLVEFTFTAKDASGNAIADGSYLPAAFIKSATSSAANYAFAAADTITVTNGVASVKVYAPYISGTWKTTWTLQGTAATASAVAVGTNNVAAAIAGSKIVVDVAISNAAVDAATDAANEAAQAASDATDAALAAADAADAATTKAQEAVDAVATLSAQVSKLITALKAQITTLTNLVIKIQKKVKA